MEDDVVQGGDNSIGLPEFDADLAPRISSQCCPLTHSGGGIDASIPPSSPVQTTMERPKRGKEVPAANRAARAALVEAGLTNRRVAAVLKVPVGTASKSTARVRRGMSPSPRHRSGRPPLLDARGVRHLQLVVLWSRRAILEQNTAQFNLGMPRHVSQRTIMCYIHGMALLNNAAVTKPYLTSSYVSRCLAWIRAHSAWSLAELGAGGISDESSCTVRPARGEGRGWKRPSDHFFPACLRPSCELGRSTLSVWAAFSSRGRTLLERTDGRLS